MRQSLFAAVVLSLACIASLKAQTTPILAPRLVVSGLSQPVFLTHAPGDHSRLFVVEKSGRIKIIRDGAVLPTLFLDIDTAVNDGSESGCLGLAFAPDYATSRVFYVFYQRNFVSVSSPGGAVIARFRASVPDPDVADPASQELVWFITRGAGIHNGGWIGFGADGFLWATVGDGGNSSFSQNRSYPFGKLLRIDPSGDDFPEDTNRNFRIPAGNPFVGVSGVLPEIFAYGLRNPWRASFDRDTGDMWIGDVGGGTPGEVDFIPGGSPGGLNFGWPCFDSANTGANISNCGGNVDLITQGVWAYSTQLGRSITGGYVYRGCAIPEVKGLYFVGDYVSDIVWTLTPAGGGPVPAAGVVARTAELRTGMPNFKDYSSFGEDADGELYICNVSGGHIYKIVPAAGTFRDSNANGIPDGCEAPFCGIADVGSLGGAIGPDNQLSADDIVVYLEAFFTNRIEVADIAHEGGQAGADGQLTPDDLIAFLGAFFTGCP
ncbi:MAG: PQQ-dependent sugar dehydrogenase [Phycisphaerales bacterium]